MGFGPNHRFAARTLLAALVLLGAGACTNNAPGIQTQLTHSDLQAQVDALPTPAGADANQFAQLKQAMSALIASGAVRTTSVPPTKPQAMVTDFDAEINVDQVSFTWTYANPGDYNQDGTVSVSDLSVMGRYLGRTPNSPDWDEAAAADGNRDGEVNISDLSVMGANLMSTVQGYQLRYTETPGDQGSWQVLTTLDFADAQPGPDGTLLFAYQIGLGDLPTRTAYWQVVPFDGNQLGIASNSDTLIDLPPIIVRVTPIAGQAGEQVTFSVEVFGATPLDYSWDFGNAADPTDSNDPTPTVTLGAAGTYTAFLDVSNQVGSDDFQFSITITDNVAPQVSLSATPNAGGSPLTVVLTATATDLDGTISKYEWDTDGDGQFETNTGTTPTTTAQISGSGAHTVRVRVTDNKGATATDEATVTIASLPSAVVTANSTQVIAPEFVTLDASKSSSPGGAIVKYEWDWDGNGTIDANTKAEPFYRAFFDAPPGTYKSKVIVTDAAGGTNSATVSVTVTATKFVAPPVETYQNLASNSDSTTLRWLKNVYSTLPEWQDPNGPYQNAYFAGWADEVFRLVNVERTRAGLPPCTRLRELDLVSQAHERDQALRSYFAHDTLEGLTYGDRLKAMNPPSLDRWGEIIAQGQESPAETVQQWMASPGHNAIIMTGELNFAGVGMYWKSNGAKGLESYWGVCFARFKGGSAPPAGHDWLYPEEVLP